jgi:hypothetical protein
MERPQQQEIERSGRGEVDPAGRRVTREADRERGEGGKSGPIPPGNRPGRRRRRNPDRPAIS